ncbi:MAG: helix-turn-helix domain-containing protein [Zoogloeaceae bacterium]|jgi:transcriptional regulator with XRE-family HTH domain|nr:helix-turn-helix domain-containing protein [Zoogloeaceae bacterium]
MKKTDRKTEQTFGQANQLRLDTGFGERLHQARRAKKLTRRNLADLAEVSKGTISDAEFGCKSDALDVALLAKILQVDPVWLEHGVVPDWLSAEMRKKELSLQLKKPSAVADTVAPQAEKPSEGASEAEKLALHVLEILRVAKQAPLASYRKAFLKVIEHSLDHNHDDAMMGKVADAVVRMMHLAIEGKKEEVHKKSADITEALVDAVAEQTKGKARS